MPGHICCNPCADGAPQQIEIAYHIKNLMQNEFIRKPELGIYNLLIIDKNKVVEFAAACQTPLLKGLNVTQKPNVRAGAISLLNASSSFMTNVYSCRPTGLGYCSI